jgi:hypothetical protein
MSQTNISKWDIKLNICCLFIDTANIPDREHHMFGSVNHEIETVLQEALVAQLVLAA